MPAARPDPPLPASITDKQGHSLGYFGLGITVSRALAGGLGMPLSITQALGAVALTTAYGASDEWHQIFVPGRDSNVLDWVADTIGAAIGAMLYSVGSR